MGVENHSDNFENLKKTIIRIFKKNMKNLKETIIRIFEKQYEKFKKPL